MESDLAYKTEILDFLGGRRSHLNSIRNHLKKEIGGEILNDFNLKTLKTIKQLVENGEILQTGVNYYTLNDGQGSLHLELRRTPRKNAGNAPKRFVPYYTPPYSSPRTSPVSPSRRSRLNVTPSMRKTVNTLRKQLNELNGVKDQLRDIQTKYDQLRASTEARRDDQGFDGGLDTSFGEEIDDQSEGERLVFPESPVRNDISGVEVTLAGTLKTTGFEGEIGTQSGNQDEEHQDLEALKNEIVDLERTVEDLTKEIEAETVSRMSMEKKYKAAEDRLQEQKEAFQAKLDLYQTESRNSSLVLDAENLKLESDIQDVKIRLDLAESEIQRVREAYEILTQSKAALESETDSYKCQIEKLLADLGELRAKNVEHLDLQKAADAKFGAELEILEEKVKDLEQQLKLAHLQQENYRAENVDLKQEIYLLKTKIGDSGKMCSRYQNESKKMRENMNELKSKILLLFREYADMPLEE